MILKISLLSISYHGLLQLCQDIDTTDVTPLVAFSRWVERAFLGVDCWDFDYYSRTDLLRNTEWNQPGTNNGSEYSIAVWTL